MQHLNYIFIKHVQIAFLIHLPVVVFSKCILKGKVIDVIF